MSELPEELQRELNRFHEYCTTWKLKVNVEKTSELFLPYEFLKPQTSEPYKTIGLTTLSKRSS
jgi:hypothetical protein